MSRCLRVTFRHLTLQGVVHGGVGRHVSDVVAAEGPGVVVIFLKVGNF